MLACGLIYQTVSKLVTWLCRVTPHRTALPSKNLLAAEPPISRCEAEPHNEHPEAIDEQIVKV